MSPAMCLPLRTVVGETISELVAANPRVVVLDGDVGSSTGVEIVEQRHPKRFFQMGIAEQNLLGVAAGMATVGYVPVVSAFACFAVGRAFDSIRVLIDQPALDVKITGGYTGLLTGMTGKTHQIFNDVAIMRTLPNMTVLAPADEEEARQATRAMIAAPGPFYMQVTREPGAALFDSSYRFEIGKGVVLRTGTDVALVSTGVQTTRVVEAAELLAAQGIEATILHLPTIKPIDGDAIEAVARATGFVVVVEEQSVLGGLGGAIAELISDRCPVTVKRLGLQDCYGQSGPNDALLERYRLSAHAVAADVRTLLEGRAMASRIAAGSVA